MKVNLVYVIIGLAISALIAFGFYSFHEGSNKMLLVIGSMIFMSITLTLSFAVKINERPRSTVLIRTVSGIMFFVGLVANISFSLIKFEKDWYIIIIGLILLIYCLILYTLVRSKQ
jgi:hypothetical protein